MQAERKSSWSRTMIVSGVVSTILLAILYLTKAIP